MGLGPLKDAQYHRIEGVLSAVLMALGLGCLLLALHWQSWAYAAAGAFLVYASVVGWRR